MNAEQLTKKMTRYATVLLYCITTLVFAPGCTEGRPSIPLPTTPTTETE